MSEIILIEPTIEYADDIMRFRKEIMDSDDQDKFAGCGSLEDCETAQEWIDSIVRCREGKTDKVPSDVYIAVRRNDNRIVGIIDLRHHIDHPILGTWGGHMGYYVRPTERHKGYAKEMLRQNLMHCRALGIKKVLITCDDDNYGSERTILANGGAFEKMIEVDGRIVKRYWITL